MNFVTPEHEGSTVWIKTSNPYDRSGPSLVKIAHVFDDGDAFLYHDFYGKKWPYQDQLDSQFFTKEKRSRRVTDFELLAIAEESDNYIPVRKPKIIPSLYQEFRVFVVTVLHGLLRAWGFKL